MNAVLAIFTGAGLGALLRWFLGQRLNAIIPSLPLGTLTANLLGGLLIGLPSPGPDVTPACRPRSACSSSPAFSAD